MLKEGFSVSALNITQLTVGMSAQHVQLMLLCVIVARAAEVAQRMLRCHVSTQLGLGVSWLLKREGAPPSLQLNGLEVVTIAQGGSLHRNPIMSRSFTDVHVVSSVYVRCGIHVYTTISYWVTAFVAW